MKTSARKSSTASRLHFCGVREQLGDGSKFYMLRNKRPTWTVAAELGLNMPRSEVISCCREALNRWQEVCDIVFSYTDDPAANLRILGHDFGSRGGTLADCQMPQPNLKQQDVRVDRRERWGAFDGEPRGDLTDLIRTLCHEFGHFIGFPHFSSNPPPELLEPTYGSVIRPQAGEIFLAQKHFGPPVAGPSPGADAPEIDLTITVGGVKYRASGKAKPVK